MRKALRSPQVWLGLAISVVTLSYAVYSIPFGELLNIGYTANWGWVFAAVALQILSVVARAQRWLHLLGKKNLSDSFWAANIGFLFNNVLPLRLGEVARVIVMAERSKLSIAQVGVTVVIERVLDVATVVLVLALSLPFMQVPAAVANAGWALGVVAVLVLCAVPIVGRWGDQLERWVIGPKRIVSFWPSEWLSSRWHEITAGFRPLSELRPALWVALWSALAWAFSIGVYVCSIRVFQPEGSLLEAAFMVVSLSFAVSVPSSPGFVGVYQLAGQQALAAPFPAKYSLGLAFACTMVAYLVYYLTTSALGAFGLSRMGLSFTALTRRISSSQDPTS